MNSLSLGGDEPHRTWLYPGEADEPGPTWLLQQKLPAGAGTSAGRSCPRFVPRLRKPREPAAPGSQGCFKELTRHQVQPGCSGKAFVLWPDRAGRAPSHPQSQEWWTDWRNRSNKYLGSRSLPGPFPPPCLQPFTPSPFRSDHWVKRPDAPLSVRQRSPRRSRLSRRVGVPGLGTKPGDVGAIPGLRPPRGTRQ